VLTLNNAIVVDNSGRTTSKFVTDDVGMQRIFLAKLFTLVATMCECTGDFFAERFRNDVWPVMASHLGYLLEQLQHQPIFSSLTRTNALPRNVYPASIILNTKHPSLLREGRSEDVSLPLSVETRKLLKLSNTHRGLYIAMLTCLHRVYQKEDCGKAVHMVLNSVGLTLLPLLDIENESKIQDLTMIVSRVL
jgi:hypothetical protein